ncbi:MAG TPA: hypothetical protein VFA74_02540 [Terriglobales bacterium]|nr:hypothetical protein [Terriglobales bacterium]
MFSPAKLILFAAVLTSSYSVRITAQTAGTHSSVSSSNIATWPECHEFLAKSPCKIIINLASVADGPHLTRSPWDVTIKRSGTGKVVLQHASPFISCLLTAAAGPSTRDQSTSIRSFLSILGALGAFGNIVIPAATSFNNAQLDQQLKGTIAESRGTAIDAQLNQFEKSIESAQAEMRKTISSVLDVQQHVQKDWQYSYSDDQDFVKKATDIWVTLDQFLKEPLPNLASLQIQISVINNAMAGFYGQFSGAAASDPRIADWMSSSDARIVADNGQIGLIQDYVSDALNIRAQLKQAYVLLASLSDGAGNFNKPSYTEIVLPMTAYSEKEVTEFITCKDAITQTPAFDTITFTAYYENYSTWDFSTGVLLSLLGGRQVGEISAPPAQTIGAITPPFTLAVTSSSSVQWIPTAFVEYHPWNFECPWKTEGSHRYVCSLGPAFGIALNPNNGAVTPEYFEGISFGIHRLAIFFGNHTGRVQDFTEGYYVGESDIPFGVTPPTHRRWTNRPAIGISYRIPIR